MRFICALLLAVLSIAPPKLQAELPAETAVVSSTQQVVVKLFGASAGTLDSYGSGVLISSDGHLLTVWNHLVNTGYLTAVVADGRRFPVKAVGTSQKHDLALLKLECDSDDVFPFVDWRRFSEATAGESILAFSNMYRVATGDEPVSVMHGVVAAEVKLEAGLGRWQFPVQSPVYVLDAVTNNSGAAGGLLTTTNGQPLGLLGRELRHRDTGMWVNYAVPWKTLQPAIAALLSGERISSREDNNNDVKPMTDRTLTSVFGLTMVPAILPNTPAYVDRIVPDSAADKTGLQRGDLVLMVQDNVVRSVEDLRKVFSTFRTGQAVALTVSRSDQLQQLSLRVP